MPASVEHCIVAELGGNTTVFAALAGSPGFHTLDYSVQTSVAVGALRCTSTGGLNAGYTTNVLPVGPEHLADEDYLACVDSYLAGGSGSDVMAGLIIRSELVPVAGAPRDAVEAMAADCINDAFVVANFVNRDAVIDGYVEECVSQALVANGDAISRQVVANALSAPNELPNYTVPPGALPECLQPQG